MNYCHNYMRLPVLCAVLIQEWKVIVGSDVTEVLPVTHFMVKGHGYQTL